MKHCIRVSLRTALASMLTVTLLAGSAAETSAQAVSANEFPAADIAKIAEEAYLYGFPMLVGYKMLYEFNVDRNFVELAGKRVSLDGWTNNGNM